MHAVGRLIAGGVVVLAVVSWSASVASAQGTGGAWVDEGGGIEHGASNHASSKPVGTGPTGPVCEYRPLPVDSTQTVFDIDGHPVPVSGRGAWYEVVCDGRFQGARYIDPVDPQVLLADARKRLVLPLPTPKLSPAGDQLVNLESWLWIDGSTWQPLQSTAAVPGVSVTVTATPVSVRWSPGDGSSVTCTGPGTPWDPTRPDRPSSCTHTYTRSSAHLVGLAYSSTVTVVWHATWSAAGANGGGDLGTIERSVTIPVRVGEAQALNVWPH